jgi:hypothetical protein
VLVTPDEASARRLLASYDYTRAARDALHFAALFDRLIQNLRLYVGYHDDRRRAEPPPPPRPPDGTAGLADGGHSSYAARLPTLEGPGSV